jgi:hypothetical protein
MEFLLEVRTQGWNVAHFSWQVGLARRLTIGLCRKLVVLSPAYISNYADLCDCTIGVSFWLWQVIRTTAMGQPHQRRRHQYPHHQHCTALRSPLISNTALPFSNTSYLWLLVLVFVTCSGALFSVAEGKPLTDVTSSVEHHQVIKRSATDGSLPASDYPEYQSGVRSDEYPVSTNGWVTGWTCEPITRIALL